jgi:hypothetical protein
MILKIKHKKYKSRAPLQKSTTNIKAKAKVNGSTRQTACKNGYGRIHQNPIDFEPIVRSHS